MKCLYVGKFARYFSTENYISHALEQYGIEVLKVPYKAPQSIDIVETFSPDFILFSKANSSLVSGIMNLSPPKPKTICWQFDLYWGYRGRNVMPPQFWADYLFTTDGGHDSEWGSIGCNHHTLRQGIHQPDYQMFSPRRPVWDIGFVGGVEGHPSRQRLIEWLQRRYVRSNEFKIFSQTRGLDLNKALAKCNVIVGDSYPASNYWSNRIYEMLGRGAFLLHPETEGLDSEFTDGEHYVSYRRDDYDQLEGLISHYLQRPQECERIRQQGFERCGEYTYHARVGELLRVAGLSP